MIGPRMFVAGYGLHVTSSPYRPGSVQQEPCQADLVLPAVP